MPFSSGGLAPRTPPFLFKRAVVAAAFTVILGGVAVPGMASTQASDPTPEADTDAAAPAPKLEPSSSQSSMQSGADSAATSTASNLTVGSFKPTKTGAATYAVPISVPPGTLDVAPKLAFVYDSHGADGLLGFGWLLDGLPAVERCPATIAQDGFKGGISFDANDRFCLSGQRLMAISGAYGGDGTEYRTEIDSGIKVTSHGAAGSGPASFRVRTKAGHLMEFGVTEDSRIEVQGKTSALVWGLNRLQDASGNYLTAAYFEDNPNGEYRPLRIDYTGNASGGLSPQRSVQFVYASRPDVSTRYVAGSLVRRSVRLTNVQTFVASTLARDYRLAYDNAGAVGRSRLSSITACGGDGSCIPATVLGWQSDAAWQPGGGGFNATQA